MSSYLRKHDLDWDIKERRMALDYPMADIEFIEAMYDLSPVFLYASEWIALRDKTIHLRGECDG